jgi:vitamin B12 transporter
MKQEKLFSILLCSLSAGILSISNSQAQEDTARSLSDVVITASRSEKKVSETGRSITVITSDQIKNSIYNSLSELLSQQEGIYIVGNGQTPGMTQSIFTRGSNSNHTTILIDDVRITDPSAINNAPDLSELSLSNIERIEIVRGSHSTMYGTSAIGGVVNIITKKGQKPGLNMIAETKAGTFGKNTGMIAENLFLNYTTKGGFYLNAEVFNTNVRGLDATVDTVTDPAVFQNRDQDGWDKMDLIAKAGFTNKKLDVYVSGRRTSMQTDIDDGAYRDDNNYTLDFHRYLLTYGASYKLGGKFRAKFAGGISAMDRVAVDDSSIINTAGEYDHTFADATYSGVNSTNDLQLNYKSKGIDAVIGGGLYGESMNSTTYYFSNGSFGAFEFKSDLDTLDLRQDIKHVFAHTDLNGSLVREQFSPFSLGLGARLNDHNVFGNYTTWSVNPSLKLEKSLIYASWSTGFNAPSLYQLYSPNRSFASSITRGNKDLQPETSESWEFGFKQHINENLSFGVSYFNTVIENVIEYVYLWNKNTHRDSLLFLDDMGDTYLNLGTQSMNGVEFNIKSKLTEKLQVTGNFSLVSGRLDYSPSRINIQHTGGNHVQLNSNGLFLSQDAQSLGLSRRPNTANISMTYTPVKWLAFRSDIRYAGPRNDVIYNANLGPYGALGTTGVAEYTLLDLGARYTKKGFSAGVRVENIFNTAYTEIKGFTTRGRSVYLNLRYELGLRK